MMCRLLGGFIALCLFVVSGAQDATKPAPLPGLPDLLRPLAPRELGPTTMGGRVSSIAVYEKEPRIFYVGVASGGLWKTENGGITFAPVFQKESSVALGAVTVCQSDPDLVWVGTGEQNSRNSTSWGDGVYKSIDGGKTWTNMGLKDSKHIGKIVLDPKNPNTVYVAAMGHLWGPNDERGVFKSTDGGATWNKALFVDRKTGFVDLVIDPANPKVLLAAAYERMRKAYYYASGGPGSALYKSKDAGKTWKKIEKGLPDKKLGRIGLSVFAKNPKVVVATIEAEKDGGFYKSTDAGDSWVKLSSTNPRPFYFSTPVIDPKDENRVYVPAAQLHMSEDGGKTFKAMSLLGHPDYHALWVNPSDSNHILTGNDGGVLQSRDRGKTWEMLDQLPIGQFYTVSYDMRKPYFVYGGLQDNGCWAGPTQTKRGGVTSQDFTMLNGGDGFYVLADPDDWKTVYSESQNGVMSRANQLTGEARSVRPRAAAGEKMRFNWSTPFILSPHNSKTVYVGSNKLYKSVDRGDHYKVISPDLTTNDPSKLRPAQGVSPENTGAESHCTIVTISESPITQGLLWVGTDDGRLHVTQDDGRSWSDVSANVLGVPANTWVSRVEASHFAEGRAYVTFDGHRDDDYQPYVFMTEDFGKSWLKITNGIGENQSCYVIREGLRNPNLLALGTEMGLYFSLDRGLTWTRFTAENWPTVRVDDLAIHPRELDLLIGTHGRSLWSLPWWPLEALDAEARDKELVVCEPQTMYLLGNASGSETGWSGNRGFVSRNTQPRAVVYYYLKSAAADGAHVTITDAMGKTVTEFDVEGKAGLNRVTWRPFGRSFKQRTGDYKVTVKAGKLEESVPLRVEDLLEAERSVE